MPGRDSDTLVTSAQLEWYQRSKVNVVLLNIGFGAMMIEEHIRLIATLGYMIRNAKLGNECKLPVGTLGVRAIGGRTVATTLDYPSPLPLTCGDARARMVRSKDEKPAVPLGGLSAKSKNLASRSASPPSFTFRPSSANCFPVLIKKEMLTWKKLK
jgi:hypothetical protein